MERVLGVVPVATAKDVHRGVQTGGGGRTLLYMIIKYDYLKTFIEECKQEEGDVRRRDIITYDSHSAIVQW